MDVPHGLPPEQTAALTRRVTTLSVAVASILIVVKLIAWSMSGSIALLASLADSGLDLVASLVTFFAVRYAVVPPDAEHRFGHGKAEAFASLTQGGLVFASGALVGEQGIRHLMNPTPIQAEGWAMGVMVVSVILTSMLIWAQSRVLKRTGSVAVSGDRAHYAADLATNMIAFLGIGAVALTGEVRIDAAAGLAVAVLLIWGAIGVFRQAANQLMDHELPEDARGRIFSLMTADPRVKGIHQLRTRSSGPYVHIQMHADLDPGLSLAVAHEVMVEAENRLLTEFPQADVIIHPDPRGLAEPHGGAFGEKSHEPAQ